MLNKEKYAKEIVEIATKGLPIAMDNETKILCPCSDFGKFNECEKCYFYKDNYPYKTENNANCNKNIKHWANSEYVEPKEFTEQEKALIKALGKIEWVAKDEDDEVWGYSCKPHRIGGHWYNASGVGVNLSEATFCQFKAIKSTDTEPTSRETILKGVINNE